MTTFIRIPLILAAAVLLGLVSCGLAQPPAAGTFANPANRFRILKIVHNLPLVAAQQDELMKKLLGSGFGGMATNVSFRDYLTSEPNWQAFVRGVKQARSLGMALWLYDEKGYPSGNAGGLTMKDHPEWEAEGLYLADAVVAGGAAVDLALPPGKLLRAAAYPMEGPAIRLEAGKDISAGVKDGKLQWQAPAGGPWRVMAITRGRLYDNTHAAVCFGDKLPYVNLARPEPTRRFLEVTHDAYAARLGADMGQYFIATFTDEPSLMSLFMRPQAFRVIPWSDDLAREFRSRRGYDLDGVLEALFVDVRPLPQPATDGKANGKPSVGLGAARVRFDFWYTVGEMVTECFCVPIRDWCRRHNTLSGGHMLLEEPLVMHVPIYGDFFRCNRAMDAPSIDCLTSIPQDVPWFIARLLSSIGELEGRYDTMCETSDFQQRYRPAGDKRPPVPVTEEQIRGTCNRLIVNGITTITSYYTFAGLDDQALRRLNLHIGRCSQTLYAGGQVTDVALLYPVESVWPKFEPSRNWVADVPQAAREVERVYRESAQRLFQARRDFTYVDSRLLAEADAAGGVLKHRDLRWRVVVLPAADTLPMKAWENLRRFWREGGIVVAAGALPANSEKDFPCPAVQAIAGEIFGEGTAARWNVNAAGGVGAFLPPGQEKKLPAVLDALIEPEFRVTSAQPGAIRGTHRRIGGKEVFFLINDGGAPCEADVDFAAAGKGEQLDPATGQVSPLSGPQGVRVKLGAYGGMLYRFDQAKPPARLEAKGKAMP